VKWTDPKTEEEKEVIVDADDGIREGVTKESLSKLKPAFSKDGTTHAGNASQVSDGAAAVLLARRSVAQKLGLPILGKFVCSAVVGVPPKVMGWVLFPTFTIHADGSSALGPRSPSPKPCKRLESPKRTSTSSRSTRCIHPTLPFYLADSRQAFASQAVMSIQHLHLPFEIVNPNGGAIAIGHPLGCTGARQIATAFSEAKREKKKVFVTSMCIGSGMVSLSLLSSVTRTDPFIGDGGGVCKRAVMLR
jgi:acetyl-CoA acyltransferase 1